MSFGVKQDDSLAVRDDCFCMLVCFCAQGPKTGLLSVFDRLLLIRARV